MTLRAFIIFMLVATLVCWCAFIIVVTGFNPFEGGALALAFFYLSAFLSLTGTLTILGIFVRIVALKRVEYISRRVTTSFRQALLVSFVLVVTLYLMSQDMLAWWNIACLVLGLGLFEFFFISLKRLN
ncbi:hypothetical protein KJ969_05235 [Patescibacteria group bacterium]|nr:hypothetical protein [Patescibacteria group bacterium]MBU1921626.1 hypothetical protein [Patescibacteria group bacterium]